MIDNRQKLNYICLANEDAMATVTIHAAKTNLSRLLARVETGGKLSWRAASARSPN
jgi:hypothetical protein